MRISTIESLESRLLLAASLVADAGGIYPTDSASLDGWSYFAADDGVHGKELWKSDGTPGGTVLVSDIVSGVEGSQPVYFFAFGSQVLFFAKRDGRSLLYATDGTADGTRLVKDLGSDPYTPLPQAVGEGAGRRLVFQMYSGSAESDSSRSTLWTSDGTTDGTVPLKEYEGPSNTLSSPSFGPGKEYYLPYINGRVLFATAGGIWSTDGTVEGTIDLTAAMGFSPDINGRSPFDVREVVRLNGSLVFAAEAFGGGVSLFATDGTRAGTRLLKDLGSGGMDAFSYQQDGSSGRIYMLMVNSDDNVIVKWLWMTDGTAEGTVLVRSFRNASRMSSPADIGDGKVVIPFGLEDNTRTDLWVSDGTDAGTKVIKSYSERPVLESPRSFTRVGGVMFYLVLHMDLSTEEYVQDLWRTDGTAEGTVVIDDLASIQASGPLQSLMLDQADGKLLVQLREWSSTGQASVIRETLVFDPASLGPASGPTTSSLALDDDRVLRVFGTRGDDNIRIYRMQDNDQRFIVSLNGVKRSFAFADVRKLIVHGYSGDDAIAYHEANGLITLRSMIWGGDGNDTIHGNSTRDSIWGDAGEDLIKTGRSADRVDGGIGDDSVFGSTGDDTLNGQAGADTLNGGRDDDMLGGGDDEGEDHLDGGGGADVIFGKAVFEIFFNGKQDDVGDPLDEILIG